MELKEELKVLIISSLELEGLTPDDIDDDAPLFGEGLGLDSVDALELGIALKKKYGITLQDGSEENKKRFASVNALAGFVAARKEAL